MSKPINITENAQLVATDQVDRDGQKIYDLVIDYKVVGQVRRTIRPEQITSKTGKIVATHREGWEWNINRTVSLRIGYWAASNYVTTSPKLFANKIKAAASLVELITARTGV